MRSLLHAALALGIAAAAALAPRAADAQAVPSAAERAHGGREDARNRRAVAEDALVLDRLSDLVLKWNVIRATGGAEEEEALVLREIRAALQNDLAENAAMIKKEKKESRASRREPRSGRREAMQADASAGAAVQALLDLRGDSGGAAGEARGAKLPGELLSRKRILHRELMELQRRLDGSAADPESLGNRRIVLLERYLDLSCREIEMGYRELSEDCRALHRERRASRERGLQR